MINKVYVFQLVGYLKLALVAIVPTINQREEEKIINTAVSYIIDGTVDITDVKNYNPDNTNEDVTTFLMYNGKYFLINAYGYTEHTEDDILENYYNSNLDISKYTYNDDHDEYDDDDDDFFFAT